MSASLLVAGDQSKSTKVRVESVRRSWAFVSQGGASVEQVRATLGQVVWNRAEPEPLRIAALEALFADQDNIADTQHMLQLLLPTESAFGHDAFLKYTGVVAAERQWVSLVPAYVAAWSRIRNDTPDSARLERDVITALVPSVPVQEVVAQVFTGTWESTAGTGTGDVDLKHRRAAWALLRRLDTTGQEAIHALRNTRADDPLAAALHASEAVLGWLPSTVEQLENLERWHTREGRAQWDEAIALVRTLTAEQQQGIGLRHLPVLMFASAHTPELMRMDVARLEQRVRSALDKRKVVERRHGGPADGERIQNYAKQMVWGDMLAVCIAEKITREPVLHYQLFSQADRDIVATDTELGGVVKVTDGGAMVLALYEPVQAQRLGDDRFVPSNQMLDEGYAALFHYHFHAMRHNGRRVAGPSKTDITAAKRLGSNGLVATFIDAHTINLDYFQGDGSAVDLGLIYRP